MLKKTSTNKGHSHTYNEGQDTSTSVDNGHNHILIFDRDGKVVGLAIANGHTHSL